ncbi:MAG: hypothetical protein FWC98_00225 [Bacteroidales bacterium]|nr:hypothetical protein [Bacteroidales bacterium]
MEILSSAFATALSEKLEIQNLLTPLTIDDVIERDILLLSKSSATTEQSVPLLSKLSEDTVDQKARTKRKKDRKECREDRKEKRLTKKSKSPEIKQIVQLTPVPDILNLNDFRDPVSSLKPNGNYGSAHSLYVLANSVPSVLPFFQINGNSLTDLWGRLVSGAITEEESDTSIVLSEAQKKFRLSEMRSRVGYPDDWHLVETKPYNWYDLLSDKHMITLDIDLQNNACEGKGTNFLTIDGMQSLGWKVLDKKGKWTSKPIQRRTKIKKLQVKVLKVDFKRSWFINEIFEREWKVRGLKKGYYSSGDLKENKGTLPLIIDSMLVSTEAIIRGEIDKKDEEIFEEFSSVALGGFVLSRDEKSPQMPSSPQTAFVVGYISRLVPLAPALDG